MNEATPSPSRRRPRGARLLASILILGAGTFEPGVAARPGARPGAGRGQEAAPRDLVSFTRERIEREQGRLAARASEILRAVMRKEIVERDAAERLVALGPGIVPALWSRLEEAEDSPQAARAGRAAATAIVRLGSAEDRERLLGLARSPGPARLKAIPALAGMPGPESWRVLQELAGHEDPGVRLLACDAVAAREEAGVPSLLLRLLADEDSLVRTEAATFLRGRVSPEERAAILEVLAHEETRAVRIALYDLLGSLRGDAVVQALENGAIRDASSPKAMGRILSSLEAIGGDRAEEVLWEIVQRRGPEATAARKSLVRLGDRGALDPLVAPYRRALKREPKRPELYRRRGDLFREVWMWDRASDDYERALSLLPRDAAAAPAVAVDLARCYVHRKMLKRAHDLLRRRGPKDLSKVAGDEDFAPLRVHPTYGDLFGDS